MMHSVPTGLLRLLFLVGCAWMTGCDGSSTPPSEPTAEEKEEREKKALALLMKAESVRVFDKAEYYQTLLSHYPESRYTPDAHFRLVRALMDPTVDRMDDALEALRTFRSRHVDDLRVSEAYKWLVTRYHETDAEKEGAILREWRAHLDAVRARPDLTLELKGGFWLESALAHGWNGDDLDQATRLLREAGEWELEDRSRRLEILFRLGTLEASRGEAEKAREAFTRAVAVVRQGARGPSEEQIQAEIDKL
jgi:tetratricopeptide (TPR) repeat protein